MLKQILTVNDYENDRLWGAYTAMEIGEDIIIMLYIY